MPADRQSASLPRYAQSAFQLFGLLALLMANAASASHGPPWIAEGEQPLPEGVKSVRARKDDQPIHFGPTSDSPRRGSIARDVPVPLFAVRSGSGCRRRWLEIGPLAWLCEDTIDLSFDAPVGADFRLLSPSRAGLPFRYFFVGPDGSFAYRRLDAVDVAEPDMQLEPGFGVAIAEERAVDGALFGRTRGGLWVPMRDLGPARPLAFRGELLQGVAGSIPFAWVVVDRAKVFKDGPGFLPTRETMVRFQLVPLLETRHRGGSEYVRIDDRSWLLGRDIRHPTLAAPPDEVNAQVGERWIDIELSTQTLVAYEGRRPVFATLVSTGKGREGAPNATPRGIFRIWIKLLHSDMDNLDDEGAAGYYRMEGVPHVQYFSNGVGLHGAFWHRSFGHVRSHGCVNMTALDAEWLFHWTAPRLPAGWLAVLPTAHDRGTVVRVR